MTLTLKSGETVNQGAARLAEEHLALVTREEETPGRYGDQHAAIAFCECETARAYRACKADPRYIRVGEPEPKVGKGPEDRGRLLVDDDDTPMLRILKRERARREGYDQITDTILPPAPASEPRGANEPGTPGKGRVILVALDVSGLDESTLSDLAGLIASRIERGRQCSEDAVPVVHDCTVWDSARDFLLDKDEGKLEPWVAQSAYYGSGKKGEVG